MTAMTSSAARASGDQFEVGISDLVVRRANSGTIVTHALGSCIGITLFDPEAGVAGLLHFMLPKPSTPAQGVGKPEAMFATTGIPKLFREVYELGARKERLIVCAAGGSAFLEDNGRFQIGKRNKMMMRKLFWKNGIKLNSEDLDGSIARTLAIDSATGAVKVLSKQTEKVLWTPAA